MTAVSQNLARKKQPVNTAPENIQNAKNTGSYATQTEGYMQVQNMAYFSFVYSAKLLLITPFKIEQLRS